MSAEVRVTSNAWFELTPNLDQVLKEDTDGITLDKIGIFIEDLGIKGAVSFIEIHPNLVSFHPILFPAGPALPIQIAMEIEGLTMQGLTTINGALRYESVVYSGSPVYDDLEILEDEYATLRVFNWIDPETEEECNLLFPGDAIEGIRYMVSAIGTTE